MSGYGKPRESWVGVFVFGDTLGDGVTSVERLLEVLADFEGVYTIFERLELVGC